MKNSDWDYKVGQAVAKSKPEHTPFSMRPMLLGQVTPDPQDKT